MDLSGSVGREGLQDNVAILDSKLQCTDRTSLRLPFRKGEGGGAASERGGRADAGAALLRGGPLAPQHQPARTRLEVADAGHALLRVRRPRHPGLRAGRTRRAGPRGPAVEGPIKRRRPRRAGATPPPTGPAAGRRTSRPGLPPLGVAEQDLNLRHGEPALGQPAPGCPRQGPREDGRRVGARRGRRPEQVAGRRPVGPVDRAGPGGVAPAGLVLDPRPGSARRAPARPRISSNSTVRSSASYTVAVPSRHERARPAR